MIETRTPADTEAAGFDPDGDAPVRRMLQDAFGYLLPACLRVAAELGVADALAAGPLGAAELAAQVGASEEHLARVLRLLAEHGVFVEHAPGTFALTAAAQFLRTGHPQSVRNLVLLLTDEMYWRCSGRLGDAVRSGHTVFDDTFGSPIFGYLAANPSAAQTFHDGIGESSRIESRAIVEAYPFPAEGTVVDIGGGSGAMLAAVLRARPGLRGTLFDQEQVIKESLVAGPDLAGRWATAAGDFFGSVPAGADVYLLQRVLHDWEDDDCVRLLTRCREAMSAGSRLLIVEAVLPADGSPHVSRLYDIAMMVLFDGRERTADEFAALVAAAGLTVERVIGTSGPLSVIEVARG